MKIFTFTVSGRGVFPSDMLRYDRCWPKTTDDATMLHVLTRSSLYQEQRTVTLSGLKMPTEGRWKSFGWDVVKGSVRSQAA